MSSNSLIIVGIDGSEEARNALRWAVAEAHLRNAKLHVVHAWDSPGNYWDTWVPTDLTGVEDVQRKMMESDISACCSAFPDVPVESELVNDLPVRSLIERAKGADLLVVGSRGRGGFVGLLVGSVPQQLLHHAPCPVVVVPTGR